MEKIVFRQLDEGFSCSVFGTNSSSSFSGDLGYDEIEIDGSSPNDWDDLKSKLSASFPNPGGAGSSTELPYKKYVALLTQNGTGIPTALILENELGGTPVFSRLSAGNYLMTLIGAFPADLTAIFIGSFTSVGYAVNISRSDDDILSISTGQPSPLDLFDNILLNTPVEIRIYTPLT